MNPTQIGEVIGVGVASAAAALAAARKWLSPSEKKIDKVIEGLGAGNGGPTIVSLVVSTAERLQHVANHLDEFHGEFREHDEKEALNREQNRVEHAALQTRLEAVEMSTEILDKTQEVASDLAAKTEETAKKLREENQKNLKIILDGQKKLLAAKKAKR